MATASPQRSPTEPTPSKPQRRFTLKNIKLRSPFKCITTSVEEPMEMRKPRFSLSAIVDDADERIDKPPSRSISFSTEEQGEQIQRKIRRSLSVSTPRHPSSFASLPRKSTNRPDMMTKAERVYDPYEAVKYRKRHMGGPQGKAVYKTPAVESTFSHLRRPETITPWKKEANVTEMPPQVSRLPPGVTTKATRYKIVANENIKFPPGLVRSPEQRQIVKRAPIVDDDEMERPEGIDSVTYKRFSNLVKKHQRNAGEESPRTPRRSGEDYYENDLTPVARLARTAGRGKEQQTQALQESGLGFANWNEIVDAIDLNATVKQSLRSPTSPTSGGNSPINSMDSLKLQTPQESQQGSTANKRGSYIYRQEMDFEPNVRRTRRRSDPRTPVKRGQVPMPRSAGAISDGRYNANSVGIASDHQPPASCPSTPRTSQDHVRFADTREGSISINANVYDTTAIDENVMASAKEDQKMAHAAMTKHIPAQIDTDVAQTAEPVTVKYSPLPRTPGKSHAHGSTRGRELVGVTDETVSPSSAVRVVLQGDSDTHQLSPKYSNDNPGLMRSETMVLISPRPEATEKCKNPMHDAKSVATGSDEGSTHDSTSPYVVEHRRVMGIHPLVADRGVETGRLMTSSTMQSITPIYHRDFAYEANDANNDYQN